MAPNIILPRGMSWHPDNSHPERIVARVANPDQPGSNITQYRTIKGLARQDIVAAIDQLQAWRIELGSQLWTDWPNTRTRASKTPYADQLPEGVTCYYMRKTTRGRAVFRLFVAAYWQDYSLPRNNKGNYRQKNRIWTLAPTASYREVVFTISLAWQYRNLQLRKHPRPCRSEFNQRKTSQTTT